MDERPVAGRSSLVRRLLFAVLAAFSVGAAVTAAGLLARFGARVWLVAFMLCTIAMAMVPLMIRTLRRPDRPPPPP